MGQHKKPDKETHHTDWETPDFLAADGNTKKAADKDGKSGQRINREHQPLTRWEACKYYLRRMTVYERVTAGIAIAGVAVAGWVAGIYDSQLNTMRQQMIVSQRAFVFAEKVTVSMESEKVHSVAVTLKNSGPTASRRQTATLGTYFNERGLPGNVDCPIQSNTRPILVGPNSETFVTTAIPEDDFQRAMNHKTYMFVCGSVNYEDIFHYHHRTQYTFQFSDFAVSPTGVTEYRFFTGPIRNCDDEDCDNEPKN